MWAFLSLYMCMNWWLKYAILELGYFCKNDTAIMNAHHGLSEKLRLFCRLSRTFSNIVPKGAHIYINPSGYSLFSKLKLSGGATCREAFWEWSINDIYPQKDMMPHLFFACNY